MDPTLAYASDIAFTASVKAVQGRKGSRRAYARVEERGSWRTVITPDLAGFIEAQKCFPRHREPRGTTLHPAPRRPT